MLLKFFIFCLGNSIGTDRNFDTLFKAEHFDCLHCLWQTCVIKLTLNGWSNNCIHRTLFSQVIHDRQDIGSVFNRTEWTCKFALTTVDALVFINLTDVVFIPADCLNRTVRITRSFCYDNRIVWTCSCAGTTFLTFGVIDFRSEFTNMHRTETTCSYAFLCHTLTAVICNSDLLDRTSITCSIDYLDNLHRLVFTFVTCHLTHRKTDSLS